MNEVLLALLGFGLGALATIITQTISRRLQFADARRKQKLRSLQQVREWMEAYRALFRCKYPELPELVFAHKDLVPDRPFFDQTAPLRVYQALKEYQEANTKYEEAARVGWEALEMLGERGRLDMFIFLIERLLLRKDIYLLLCPRGFPRKIAPYLRELSEQRYNLFQEFPERFAYRIDWDKLEFTDPAQVSNIIHSRLARYGSDPMVWVQQEIDIADATNNLGFFRGRAEQAINGILGEIRKYEQKWLVPEPGS